MTRCLVFGRHGRYGAGHAWAEYFIDGKCFLDWGPLLSESRRQIPDAKHAERYTPRFSISWDGTQTLRPFAHEENVPFRFCLEVR